MIQQQDTKTRRIHSIWAPSTLRAFLFHLRIGAACGLLVACAHPSPPVYLVSMRASTGPDPVLVVAYSDVVGPPLAARGGGITFLRPARRHFEVVGEVRRAGARDPDVDGRPVFLHGAVGGARPWVALTDEEWRTERDDVPARDAAGRRHAPLRGRDPARIDGGFVTMREDELAVFSDTGSPLWHRALLTAEAASCAGTNGDDRTPRHAVSPAGTVIAGARWFVRHAATCTETVVRVARLRPDGTPLGPDSVLRLEPPGELWDVSPTPDAYGTSEIALAVQDDGATLVALSSYQPGGSSGSHTNVVKLVRVSPDGAVRTLRPVPGVMRALAVAGSSWLVLLESSGNTESTLIVLGADGHHLADFAIPRRRVAMMSLPEGAFVAWRATERGICGMPLGEDGRRGPVVCGSLSSLHAHPLRRER